MIPVFICYRHEDSWERVKEITIFLKDHLDDESVIIDRNRHSNWDFFVSWDTEQRVGKVKEQDVLIVIIGPYWTQILKERITVTTQG
jgi:hypothetical protein